MTFVKFGIIHYVYHEAMREQSAKEADRGRGRGGRASMMRIRKMVV